MNDSAWILKPRAQSGRRPGVATRRNRAALALAAATTMLPSIFPAFADAQTWTAASGSWSNPANWNNGAGPVPGAGDSAVISNADATSRTVTYDYAGSPISLYSLTLSNTGGATDSLSLSDATLSASNEILGNSGTTGLTGLGAISQSVGSNTVTGTMILGYGSHDVGSYLLSGSGSISISAGAAEYIGYGGEGTFVQTGGTHSLATGTSLTLGELYTSKSTTYTLSGSGVLDASNVIVSVGGPATIDQTGGACNITSTLTIGDASYLSDKGTYNLSGGTLNATEEDISVFRGNGYFIQSGGLNQCQSLNLAPGNSFYGYYTLTASGTLAVSGSEVLWGEGSLVQYGGTNTTPDIYLITGTYHLAGGSLSTSTLNGQGGFIQTGGSAQLGAVSGLTTSLIIGNNSGNTATATLASASIGSITLNNAGSLAITASTSTNSVDSLIISGNGTLNLTSTSLFVDYTAPFGPNPGPDPIATIAAYLKSGYNNGAWNGPGIATTSPTVVGGLGYGIGFADSADPGNPAHLGSGTIEIKYTLLGDANLDGVVNAIDFGILAANFNKGVAGWDQGDFNYDNVVSAIDFGELAANFNKGASGAAVGLPAYDDPQILAFAMANGLLADVPEPVSSAGLVVAGATLLTRRKRASRMGS